MMRILFILAFLTSSISVASAQVANDECSGLIDLGAVPSCDNTIYTNVDATASDIGDVNSPTCFNGGTTQRDVWFSFTTTTDITDVIILLQGVEGANNAIVNPQIAIYRGICADNGLSEVQCVSASIGDNSITFTMEGLLANATYFIRVNDYSSTATPNWGDFTLCIEELVPPVVMGGVDMSTECFGTLYDSGGPDAPYSLNEDLTFMICPDMPNTCIDINVASFNIEDGFDELVIHEGNSTDGDILALVDGSSIGNTFTVNSSSDCVTLHFTSDGSSQGDGFELTWQCSSQACEESGFDNPTVIPSFPFSGSYSTCDGTSTFVDSPCNSELTEGPEYVFVYDAPGGVCSEIQITNAVGGTGIMILNGLPDDPATNCIAVTEGNLLSGHLFDQEGTYYIVIANSDGCSSFDISIQNVDCPLSPALVDALCNPLNGCIEAGGVPSVFQFEDGFQDMEVENGVNSGCWFGVGAEPDFYWFTIEAQEDGPFGFILESADIPSDIDFNVWGPFTQGEVCDNSVDIVDFIRNNEPVRSSYAGGADPTGLIDVHPTTGTIQEEGYDCDGAGLSNNDDFVSTIPAQEGEVYVVLVNDWGNEIQGGGILVDWSPSYAPVLDPVPIAINGLDTAVCAGQTVQLSIDAGIEAIEWIDPNGTLSCTQCPSPIATVNETTTYQVIVDAICYIDTVDAKVRVIEVDAGPDVTVCNGEEFMVSAGTDFEFATYQWDVPPGIQFSCLDCAEPMVTANVPGTYTVTANMITDMCSASDDLIITVLAGEVADFTISDDQLICENEDVNLGGALVMGNQYTWTSSPEGFSSDTANPSVSPDVTTTYYLSVVNTSCPQPTMDSVTITVDSLPNINIANDTTICVGDSIQLGNTTLEDNTTYLWTGPEMMNDANDPNTIAYPAQTGTYTLTADRNGCVETASFDVNVSGVAINSMVEDTLYLCLGESIDLVMNVDPPTEMANWVPNNGSLNSNTGNSVIATPEATTLYVATVGDVGCFQRDSVFIKVDSLPAMSMIMADPEQESYCEGDIITLFSEIYEPGDFPDLEHQWEFGGLGYETPDTLWNMVITAQDTFTYKRYSTNNACSGVDSIVINVERPLPMSIVPMDTTICLGESIQLQLSYDGDGELSWMPEDGSLSCLDCFDPVATPTNSTTFSVTTDDQCPSSASANIEVIAPPAVMVTGTQFLCPEQTDAVTLNGQIIGVFDNYAWSSSDDPAGNVEDFSVSVLPAMTSTYTFTATNMCGEASEDVQVIVADPPTVSIPDLQICNGDAVLLSATTDAPTGTPETFNWIYDSEIIATVNNVEYDGITSTSDYTLEYMYGNGCGPITVDGLIEVFLPQDVTLTASHDTIPGGDELTLTAEVPDPNMEGLIYTWYADGENIGETTTNVFQTTAIGDGDVNYSVDITTPGDCMTTDDVSVYILTADVEIPNVFTPNKDEVNEIFKVYTNGVNSVVTLKVFNRWGQVVYEGQGDDAAWDGTFKGKEAPVDVYIYYVSFEDGTEMSGDVSLIR